jgi:hypothetical protein
MTSSVDRWPNITARNLGITKEHIVCLAQVVREDVFIVFCQFHGSSLTVSQPSNRNDFLGEYKLIITAYAPPTVGVPDRLLQSPRAVLDVYVRHASQDAEHTPLWMRWSKSSVYFLHQILSFANFFIQLADLKFNIDQVCGSAMYLVLAYSSSGPAATARSFSANGRVGAVH